MWELPLTWCLGCQLTLFGVVRSVSLSISHKLGQQMEPIFTCRFTVGLFIQYLVA